MRRKSEHGLYAVVFAAAILLAVLLAYQGFKRMGRDPLSWRPSGSGPRRAGKWDGVDRSPSQLPPLSLVGSRQGGAAPPKKAPPPAIPMPPITPDIEGD